MAHFNLLMEGHWTQSWDEMDTVSSRKTAHASSNTPLNIKGRLFYGLWLGLCFNTKNIFIFFAHSLIFIHIMSLFLNSNVSWEPYIKNQFESLYVIIDRFIIFVFIVFAEIFCPTIYGFVWSFIFFCFLSLVLLSIICYILHIYFSSFSV